MSALPPGEPALLLMSQRQRAGKPTPVSTTTVKKSHTFFQGQVKRGLKYSGQLRTAVFLDSTDWAREGPVSLGKLQSSFPKLAQCTMTLCGDTQYSSYCALRSHIDLFLTQNELRFPFHSSCHLLFCSVANTGLPCPQLSFSLL